MSNKANSRLVAQVDHKNRFLEKSDRDIGELLFFRVALPPPQKATDKKNTTGDTVEVPPPPLPNWQERDNVSSLHRRIHTIHLAIVTRGCWLFRAKVRQTGAISNVLSVLVHMRNTCARTKKRRSRHKKRQSAHDLFLYH